MSVSYLPSKSSSSSSPWCPYLQVIILWRVWLWALLTITPNSPPLHFHSLPLPLLPLSLGVLPRSSPIPRQPFIFSAHLLLLINWICSSFFAGASLFHRPIGVPSWLGIFIYVGLRVPLFLPLSPDLKVWLFLLLSHRLKHLSATK